MDVRAAPQAADTAEATAVDHYFSSSTENIFVPLSTDTGKTDYCYVMHPRSAVGGAIRITQLLGLLLLYSCICTSNALYDTNAVVDVH